MESRDAPSAVPSPPRVAAAHRALAVVHEAEPGLLRLTGLARRLLGADAAMVSLLDDAHEHLHATVGLPDEYAGAAVPLAHSLCVEIVATDGAVVVADLREHEVHRHHPAIEVVGLRSYAAVPLRDEGLVLGGLCVFGREPRAWDDRSLELLDELAAPMGRELHLRGLAGQLSHERDAQQRRTGEQSALRRVATAVARSTDPEQVAAAAAVEVAGSLSAGAVLLVRFLPDGGTQVVGRGGAHVAEVDVQQCSDVLAHVRSRGVGVRGATGCLAAPVRVTRQVWGALLVTGAAVGATSLVQLTQLADLAGLGIGNAEAHVRLVELSRTDPLTGAANRRAFGDRLAEELERARRQGTATTLALLDLDRFKALNDQHGHVVGDRVLCELVSRVTAELRTGDVLARLGGDEFAVLLPTTGYEDATAVLERLHGAVADRPLAGVDLTATVGATVVRAGEVGPERLYRAADEALYRAKGRARGSLVLERYG